MPELIDPCEEAEALRAARRDLVMGQAVSEVAFGEDRVRYGRADLAMLDRMIADAEAKCALVLGQTVKRRRYAMGARFRPY